MDFIQEGFVKALFILKSQDPEVFGIMWLTLRVALMSTAIAMALGVPFGFMVAVTPFRGKSVVVACLNALMSLPTVTVGLVVYAFISRRGPLGDLELLFTPAAIIIGQVILILPVMAALSCAAALQINESVRKTALTLGAGPLRAALAVLREGRFAVMAAVAAGFGRALTEVGSATMLGGNIKGATRTMTTAIAFETGKGEFAFSLALGLLLLCMAFAVTAAFHFFQRRA